MIRSLVKFNHFSFIGTPFVIAVWILSASIAKIGFHRAPKLNQIFPESCLLISIGVLIGVLLRLGTRLDVSPLTPNTFFLYMLPPIIFDAGYFMPNRLFFDHLGTILLMAVVGTIFNIAAIGELPITNQNIFLFEIFKYYYYTSFKFLQDLPYMRVI